MATFFLLPRMDRPGESPPQDVSPAGPIATLPSGSGRPDFGIAMAGNPLAGRAEQVGARLAAMAVGHGRVVAWAGGAVEAGLFDRHPATWRPATHEAFAALCDAAAGEFERAGARLIFRPHARHVLADPPTCLSFLRRREGQPVGIVLDAVGFLEPEMLGRAEDHLRRAFEALGPVCEAVLLAGGRVDAALGRIAPTGLRESEVDASLILQLADEHCPPETARLVVDAADAGG